MASFAGNGASFCGESGGGVSARQGEEDETQTHLALQDMALLDACPQVVIKCKVFLLGPLDPLQRLEEDGFSSSPGIEP